MKRFALLSACLAVMSASAGCCCFPFCGGGYGGGYGGACQHAAPCAGYAPYGSAMMPGAGISAGLAIGPTYAAAPYPMVASAPYDILPTY
jgi:hypothetical protein